jgi:hypothetical protein
MAGGLAEGVCPEFKPQNPKKKKKKPTKTLNAVNTLKLPKTLLRKLSNFNVQGICFSGRKTG